MNLENIGKDCPCYEVDCSDIMFDIGKFSGLPPNNGKLTIQVNGSTVGDFSANQQEDETINITTPTSQDIADAVAGEALLREQADNTLQSNIDAEVSARQRADRDIQAVLDGESLARVNEDRNLQSQIDAIASKSDVVDVVGTYAELQAYDTSKLNDNDVVKVLDDSTHNDAMTYYRWNKTTQTWSYIGQESPYYSKSQTDNLLATKQDNLTAGTGITLNGSTISADTTVLAEKSELSNYAEKANTYTKTEVDNLVEPKLSVEVVEQLPVQGEQNKLYLTEKSHTTQTATGNPITATITDGAGQIEDFQLDGDTYQQTYSGKNLFDKDNPNIYHYNPSTQGQELQPLAAANTVFVKIKPNTNITVSSTDRSKLDTYASVVFISGEPETATTWITRTPFGTSDSVSVTSPANATYVGVYVIYSNNQSVINVALATLQIEYGSSATTYEPFVGGIASPSPDYPQPIQTVTGTQTIAINGTDYPLDLGTIELCKLGTYQDYIWKDQDQWKIHKAINKQRMSSFNWERYIQANQTRFRVLSVNIPSSSSRADYVMSEYFHYDSSANQVGVCFAYNAQIWLIFADNTTTTQEEFSNWIATNNDPYMWHVFDTPTDTAITDATLISQLNAIASASLENGSNTITNTATGSNLAGDMKVDYFGYDPTNRYDKWLWLDINNAYEKLGS